MDRDIIVSRIQNDEYNVPRKIYAYDKETYRELNNNLEQSFKRDVKAYIKESLTLHVNDTQLDIIFNKAWENGHSDGYMEVFNEVEELLEFLTDLIATKDEED